MKKLSIIALFFSLQISAQYIIPVEQMQTYLLNRTAENHYFKDTNNVMDKFLGNWKYQSANELVEITIYKAEHYNTGGSTIKDALYIEYRYTQNNIVIFDTFGEARSHFISGLRFNEPSNTNKYHFLYREPGQDSFHALQYVDIEYIPNSIGSQPQLNWVVFSEERSVYYIPPQMPMNMVFTKEP